MALDARTGARATDDASNATEPPQSRAFSLLPPPPSSPRYTLLPEAPAGAGVDLADTGPLSTYNTPQSARRPLRRPSIAPQEHASGEVEAPPSRPLPSPPSLPEAEDIKDLLDSPPCSEQAPVSTWRPKQRYPSYGAPEESPPQSRPGKAFAIKVLDSSAELVHSYRLRYQVYESLDYLQLPNRSKLEIDPFDRYSIPFGAIAIHSGELVGTLRLITTCVQTFYARRIQRILDLAGEHALCAEITRAPRRALPSIISDHVEHMVDAYNDEGRELVEMSRAIVHPKYRGSGVSRGLMEFGLAYAMAAGAPLVLGGCVPEHVPMYARYGFEPLRGTGLDLFENVGQIAHTIVSDTKKLPEPTGSRVAMILQALRMGEPESLLEESVKEMDRKRSTVWHFNENYYTRGEIEAAHHGGARYAVG